jgi:flagella basal body P-ring formation protein FlgA
MNRLHLYFFILLGPGLATAESGPQSLESIHATAQSFVERQIPTSPGELLVEVGRMDPRLRLPACEQPLEAFFAPGARQLGNTTVGVRCNDAKSWSLYIPVTIKLTREILVLVNPLSRGATLGPSDIRKEPREVSSLASGFLTEPRQALGRQLTQTLAPGTPLSPLLLKAPALVRRGQTVVLLVNSGGLEVRMSGQALADGAEGQMVRVRNSASRRVVEGIVTAEGTVHSSM